jgi:putative Mg2+ transporter-C (MgtC) family protein
MHLLAAISLHDLTQGLLSKTVLRLVLAALLGGVIGLERQIKHRPAGLRTNMFICFGAAMYTILSMQLADVFGVGDHTRIAAQIIPGIGFIGAGSILHAKNGVTGLTTAATLFVVASIGMACGGGLYLTAVFATLLIFAGLLILGWVETQFNLKPLYMHYSVTSAKASDELTAQINTVLLSYGKNAQELYATNFNGKTKVIFCVDATHKQQKAIAERFRQSEDLRDFEAVPGADSGE